MPRLTILHAEEIDELYSIPTLHDDERATVFGLTNTERRELDKLKGVPIKIDYILQLGYIKVTEYFFNFTFQQVRQDTWFIINRYFPGTPFPKRSLPQHYHYANQKMIMQQYQFHQATAQDKLKLHQYAKRLAKRHICPKFIFDELLSFCQQRNLIRPSYSTMQAIVAGALRDERKRLVNKVSGLLNKAARKALDDLLKRDDALHCLTLLKKDPREFCTHEMRKEITKQEDLAKIYEHAETILPKLKISAKNIDFYADMARFYSVTKLKRLGKKIYRLYLLCYVHQRLFEVNDHLTTFFLYRANKYYQDAEQYAKHQIGLDNEETEQRMVKAGKLARLYSDKNIADSELRPEAFKIVPEDRMEKFAKELTARESRKNHLIWKNLEKQSRSIKLNLYPLFQNIDFGCDNNDSIKEAIDFYKTHARDNRAFERYTLDEIPTAFIPKNLQLCVIDKTPDSSDGRRHIKKINKHRYEYMLYLQLQRKLEGGQVFVRKTINYRRLEDELIPYEYWMKHKDKIIIQLNIPLLSKPITELLAILNETITARYQEVNQRIQRGENKQIKIKKGKNDIVTWKMPYKKQDDAVNNPFYEQLPIVNISDLLQYVLDETGFEQKFKHIQPRYAKTNLDPHNLIACIVAYGTGFGVRRMAEISDIGFNSLFSTAKNYFRLETLREANDLVVNHIAQLPIFQFYTLAEYGIHASLDGQKVQTRNRTIKARHSKKYLGLGKGVSSYKLVANHVPINDKIIGLNEHESHYVFDIVYNNTSDVEIAAVSGDMHSINKINFALMYLFGYRFMPRFTKFPHKTQEHLISFQKPDTLSEYLIKPQDQVDETLMVREWDNVLRILASLAMKETTQATIVRKLSSYRRSNPTLKALIEFDKIIRSLYMLDYIDDPDMRNNVHRSLNRGEALHQLISAIRKVSDKKLPGRTEAELDLYNECTRLMANCIIYYNAALLSRLRAKYEEKGSKAFSKLITRLSPVAWRHINMVGKYEFYVNRKTINLQSVIASVLADPKINFRPES